MDKVLELNYENRKGLSFGELLGLLNEEIDSCKSEEEKQSLLMSEISVQAGDINGALIYQTIDDCIGQVTDETFLIVTNIGDAMHHDESFCPQCKERKRRRFMQRTCNDCEKSTE